MSQLSSASSNLSASKEYKSLVVELKSILDKGKHQAYKAVDNIKVQTYWQLGERIVREELRNMDRAEYGQKLLDNLALDLAIEKKLLYRVIKFYRQYPIVASLMRQLSWTHYYQLIDIENSSERKFYENKIILHSWSVRELQEQIRKKLYENTENKEIENILKTTLPEIVDIQKVFKPDYNLQFIEIAHASKEKELEDKIVSNIEAFLKEFGEDFLFLGRQVPIKIDSETHTIDLILYHRGIPCVILVDLKMGKIDSRDIGQMNKYVGYFRHNRQYQHEKDAIGLIICEEAGKEEIAYALDGLEDKIFVALYKTKLPDPEQIKRAIEKL